MTLAALLLLASAPGWSIAELPEGQQLLIARQYDGSQITRYGPPTGDPDDSPVSLWAYAPGRSPFSTPAAPQTTVHGQPAEFSTLTSDGDAYGRRLRWTEPTGETLALGIEGKPSDARLHALAEAVRAESPERWATLQVATSDAPSLKRLPPGMKRVVVRRGRAGGRRWTLTALLPPGFPVAPEDRRAACYQLRFAGEQSHGFDCDEPTSWKRVGGTVFVFGELPARVKRVRVRGEHGVDASARTGRAPGYPLASFYAVPLPSNACELRVDDPDRRGDAAYLGPTGPALGGSQADRRRCRPS
jgi:hypothetical protein